MTTAELEEIRETARKLLEELQQRFPREQVTLTEWMGAGGITVSVTWPFKREEVEK